MSDSMRPLGASLVFLLCYLCAAEHAYAQLTDEMRVSNNEKITQLLADIEKLPADDLENRAYLALQLVYAYQEADDPAFARAEGKKLSKYLQLPISEKVKAYIFYRVIDSHTPDDEYDAVFKTIDAYRSSANDENSSVRRYAIARAMSKIYSALGYHERTISILLEVLSANAFFELPEYQRDTIANHLNLAAQYTDIADFDKAYEAMLVAESELSRHLSSGTFNEYILGIVSLHVQAGMARALVELQRYDEAEGRVDKLLNTARELERGRIRDRMLLLKARMQIAANQSVAALETLDTLANREGGIADAEIVNEVFAYRADVREMLGDVAGSLADRKLVMASRADEARKQNASRASFIAAELESSARQERLDELEVQNVIAQASAERSSTIAMLSGLAALLACLALIGVFRAWRTQQTARSQLQTINAELRDLSNDNYQLANVDALTQLANRRNFINQIDQIIADRSDSRAPFFVGLLDLDGFKLVNDAHGHPAGDELLMQAAQRLASCLDGKASVARLGGDEFGFILPHNLSPRCVAELGTSICEALSRPFNVERHSVKVSTSVGIANYPEVGETRAELFERADFALYHAKQNGKGHAIVFSSEHEQRIRADARLELRFHEAEVDREFDLEFQPVFNAAADTILGVEALARWNSPSLGSVAPGEFIPLAESTGQIRLLTPVLLRKALIAAQDLPEHCFLSFNLSSFEVTSIDYASSLISIVRAFDFDPRRLVFEITESAMINNTDHVVAVLVRFRREGIRIALDDFGDGFSSFSHLARMPLDFLKVDRACLEGIGIRKKEGASVLKAICDLSRNLDITTVIEGVETQEQLEVVQSAGLDLLQGFLLGRPVARAEIRELFKRERYSGPKLATLKP